MYEKNTSLIDSDINCKFEDLLCMTPDEFRSWVLKMRKLVIDIWDEQNVPPRQGKTEDEIIDQFYDKKEVYLEGNNLKTNEYVMLISNAN